MRTDKLSFYKVHHNEDADPFVYEREGKGFMVVADGMGGSGAYVHKIANNDKCKFRNFLDMLLPKYQRQSDDSNDGIKPWLEQMFKPVTDDEPDTSALWGSRIAIARFACFMRENFDKIDLSNGKERKELIDYIYTGMEKIRDKFSLKIDGASQLLMLPTTLVALKYETLNDEKIRVEVVWAGDSRAYALIPGKGLKQLSVDDEDNSGALTNVFAFKNGRRTNTEMRHKSYILPKNSCVFACSDGIFDLFEPIDNVGVESALLESIAKSNSFEELERNWYDYYAPTNHDDCTVAFVAFGCDSFEELKQSFAERGNMVKAMCDNYYSKYKNAIPIAKGEEDDPTQYVIERADRRKGDIALCIAREIMSNPQSQDPMLVQQVVDMYQELKDECAKRNANMLITRKKEIWDGIKRYLCESVETSAMRRIFVIRDRAQKTIADKINEMLNITQEIGKNQVSIKKYKRTYNSRQQNLNTKTKKDENIKLELKKRIQKRIDKIQIDIDSLAIQIENAKNLKEFGKKNFKKKSNDYFEFVQHMDGVIALLKDKLNRERDAQQALQDLYDGNDTRKSNGKLYAEDKHFIESMQSLGKDYTAIEDEINSYSRSISALDDECEMLRDKFVKIIKNMDDNDMAVIFANMSLYLARKARLEIQQRMQVGQEEVTQEILKDKIEEYFNNCPQEFEELMGIYLGLNEPTVIDQVFNASRLRLCREFKRVNMDDVKQFIAELAELEAQYLDYLNAPTGE